MSHVFLTLRLKPDQAQLDSVLRRLSLNRAEVDTAFGLRSIDPREHLYAMLVEPRAAARVRREPSVERVSGNATVVSASTDPTP